MINDNLLTDAAKALAGESITVVAAAAVCTDTVTITGSMSSLPGEAPDRPAVSISRNATAVTFNAIRSGATVGSSAGETLYAAALYDDDGAYMGNLESAVSLPSLLHTTNYDIEFDWVVTAQRRS